MPGKWKGRARGKSRGKGKSERLVSKVRYQISRRLLETDSAENIRARALEYFEEHGEEMPGVHMIGLWKNPDNRNPKHANWKSSDDADQSLAGFFNTIHGAMQKARAHAGPVKERTPRKPITEEARQSRSTAMSAYHTRLREIAEEHPSWRHEKVRAEYRKQRDRKRKRK